MTDENSNNNNNENVVVPDFWKHIDVGFFKFSGVEEVEHLKEDKHVEEDT